jgi:hypothetical protein
VLAHSMRIPQHFRRCKLVKDREDNASQLNRLGITLIDKTRKFVGAQPLIVISARPKFWRRKNHSLSLIQVLTKDRY